MASGDGEAPPAAARSGTRTSTYVSPSSFGIGQHRCGGRPLLGRLPPSLPKRTGIPPRSVTTIPVVVVGVDLLDQRPQRSRRGAEHERLVEGIAAELCRRRDLAHLEHRQVLVLRDLDALEQGPVGRRRDLLAARAHQQRGGPLGDLDPHAVREVRVHADRCDGRERLRRGLDRPRVGVQRRLLLRRRG